MKTKIKWTRVLYILGVIALILGVLDPLEGSVVIASGSMLVALTTFLTRDRYWKKFLLSFILILTGVFFMFYFSSLGGFGGNSSLSWWWATLILFYPVGWLITISTLIIRFIKRKKQQDHR